MSHSPENVAPPRVRVRPFSQNPSSSDTPPPPSDAPDAGDIGRDGGRAGLSGPACPPGRVPRRTNDLHLASACAVHGEGETDGVHHFQEPPWPTPRRTPKARRPLLALTRVMCLFAAGLAVCCSSQPSRRRLVGSAPLKRHQRDKRCFRHQRHRFSA